eukprot:9472491-Pyramimonas_sp.AAC.1
MARIDSSISACLQLEAEPMGGQGGGRTSQQASPICHAAQQAKRGRVDRTSVVFGIPHPTTR